MSSECVTHELTREDIVAMLDTSITAVNIFAGLSESLELFVIDFEVFLAADPIRVVLRHL